MWSRWFLLFFFFSSRRRHTRYWRDWSSDVCSSDLSMPTCSGTSTWPPAAPGSEFSRTRAGFRGPRSSVKTGTRPSATRSEERRVGKECRCRGSPYHEKKKGNDNRNRAGQEQREENN